MNMEVGVNYDKHQIIDLLRDSFDFYAISADVILRCPNYRNDLSELFRFYSFRPINEQMNSIDILSEHKLIQQNDDNSYSLTSNGKRVLELIFKAH